MKRWYLQLKNEFLVWNSLYSASVSGCHTPSSTSLIMFWNADYHRGCSVHLYFQWIVLNTCSWIVPKCSSTWVLSALSQCRNAMWHNLRKKYLYSVGTESPPRYSIDQLHNTWALWGCCWLQGLWMPFGLLAINVMMGGSILSDVVGIVVGHAYYFLTILHPRVTGRHYLQTPVWVYPFETDNFYFETRKQCFIATLWPLLKYCFSFVTCTGDNVKLWYWECKQSMWLTF